MTPRNDQARSSDANTSSNPTSPDRRSLLKSALHLAGASAAATLLPSPTAIAETAPPPDSGPSVRAGAGIAEVPTTAGPVAGYIRKGIFTFKGIPYGASTAGANRFRPAQKPAPWTTLRSSRQYGPIAPQTARTTVAHNDEEAFMFNWDDAVTRVYQNGAGEDCLRLNIWTPATDAAKRPVMVWIHGGGFAFGSGNEQPSYDGENLSRRGDVVVVSLNHRLNVFGFLDLSHRDPAYADSANLGMLDLVLALEWVRDNITRFGGDPNSVTIFGQSGGGSKVSLLMGMPAAEGLFHRAVVESGSKLRLGAPADAQHLADLTLAELSITPATLDRLHTLPFEQIQAASDRALHQLGQPTHAPNLRGVTDRSGFGPVLDGRVFPSQPFLTHAPELTAQVPMIIGTTLNEFTSGMNHPELEHWTDADLRAHAQPLLGDHTDTVIAAFRQQTPTAKPFDLWSRIASSPVRENAIRQAASKAALHQAPAFLYWFQWQTPILDGRPRAFHCSEIAFVFDNTDRCDTMTGGGPDARALAAIVSDAWIHFARTGNPNHPGMPTWKPFDSSTVPTMIFDNTTRLVESPDRAEQAAIASIPRTS